MLQLEEHTYMCTVIKIDEISHGNYLELLISVLTSLACDKMLAVLFASFCTPSGPACVSATLCNGRPALSPTTVEV